MPGDVGDDQVRLEQEQYEIVANPSESDEPITLSLTQWDFDTILQALDAVADTDDQGFAADVRTLISALAAQYLDQSRGS